VAEEYLASRSELRRISDIGRIVRGQLVAAWGDRPIGSITREEVADLVYKIAKRGKRHMAHLVLGVAKTLFNFAVMKGTIVVSPADRIMAAGLLGPKAMRERGLDDAEVRALWLAAEKIGYPFGDAVRLLLLTGCRRSEITGMRWDEIDDKKQLLVIPAERFKSKQKHAVPLSSSAIALLDNIPRRGDHVFGISNVWRAKQKLEELMTQELGHQLRPWVIHDLRRTVRSGLSRLRVPFNVAEMCLGHGKRGLARVYDQHEYSDEMREALESWSGLVRDLITPPPENVVELRRRGAKN
jgi:integrase